MPNKQYLHQEQLKATIWCQKDWLNSMGMRGSISLLPKFSINAYLILADTQSSKDSRSPTCLSKRMAFLIQMCSRKTIQESKEKVLCVSVIMVHNQIGVRQNIEEIGKICRENKIFFHTDAAQGVGKIQVDVNKMNIDLMSISAHKLYGPKGIGALYLRRKPRVRLSPLINGGGQQRGHRSGTLPTPLIVGFGKACQVAKSEMHNDARHVQRLYKKILSTIRQRMTHVELNGDEKQRYYGNINMSFAFVEGQSLLMAMKRYAVSSGSACTSQSLEPSYVLRALGVSEDLAHTSLRIGIGRFTSDEQVDQFLATLQKSVLRLRQLSPLWEMVNEGVDLKEINWAQPH